MDFVDTITDKLERAGHEGGARCRCLVQSGYVAWADVVPIARLEAFRALKLSRLESFRALKFFGQIGRF